MSSPSSRDLVVGWTAVGLASAGGVAACCQRVLGVGPTTCLLRSAVGVPCPMCGLTTVAARVARLDVFGALRLDAVGVALLLVVAVIGGRHLLRLRSRVAEPTSRWWWIGAVGLVVVHWSLTVSGVVHLTPLA